jgi:hypothetical protein
MKLPSFQFYPGDWKKDPGIQSLSYHDRGVWFEMMLIMHESPQRGKLLMPTGKPFPQDALARLLHLDNQNLSTTLTTLRDFGVSGFDDDTGAITCRRMIRDEEIREIRISAGKKGGNPALLNQKSTTGDNQKPTPSARAHPEGEDEDEDEDIGNKGSGEGNVTHSVKPVHAPSWGQCIAWLDAATEAGADYTKKETHTAYLALGANGWKWGVNPITDWRCALERQIQTDRQRSSNGNRKPVMNAI